MGGDALGALADAREALGRRSAFAEAWAVVVITASALGRRAEALDACRAGLAQCPEHPLRARFAEWLAQLEAAGGR
jgi:hypothetical protein